MEYFIQPKDTKGSMYWEFFKGSWDANKNGWWSNDSIYLDWTLFGEIEGFIFNVVPAYDPYGETEINESQWEQIERLALSKGGLAAAIITEAKDWVNDAFCNHDVFSILGL